jgi:hypothetical protein
MHQRSAEAYLMLQAIPFSTYGLQHDAGLMLLTVKMSNGGLPGLHQLPQLTHQLTLQTDTQAQGLAEVQTVEREEEEEEDRWRLGEGDDRVKEEEAL